MGQWIQKIENINRIGEKGNVDTKTWDLLFCFSQVEPESEDWGILTNTAKNFVLNKGQFRQENVTRIENMLNDWAGGHNSPLRNLNDQKALAFSAPSYLFRGYEKMKTYFSSINLDLEANMTGLNSKTKDCIQAVNAETVIDLPTAENVQKVSELKDYITFEYNRAAKVGLSLALGSKKTYEIEDKRINAMINQMEESCRDKIETVYDSIKDSKKWYGKDNEEYTDMMKALGEYAEARNQDKEAGRGVSKEQKEKLKQAMSRCSQYLEMHDGIKFTSVGAKRRDAVKEMWDLMNQLPEIKEFQKEQRAVEQKEEERKAREESAKAEKKAREEAKKASMQAEKKAREEAKKASSQNKNMNVSRKVEQKPRGPVAKDEQWFQMADQVMRMVKDYEEYKQIHKMGRIMTQYKMMTANDQARVHEMWVEKHGMGEESWKMLKDAYEIKERVSCNFQDLKMEEEKESPKPKMNVNVRSTSTELEKESVQEKNYGGREKQ